VPPQTAQAGFPESARGGVQTELVFRHPRGGAQRGDRGATEIGLSHAPEAGLPPSKAQSTACVLT
jgi:hypothetical protein